MAKKTKSTKQVATIIAERLFTSGVGTKADRLVLMAEPKGYPPRDLGGWCLLAVRDRIEEYLNEHFEVRKR